MFDKRPSLAANFLETGQETRLRRQTWLAASLFTVLVAATAAFGASYSYHAAQNMDPAQPSSRHLPTIADMRQFIFGMHAETAAVNPLAKDRSNLLIMGIGGSGHDGPELTDTLIFAAIDTKQRKVGLVSIPRDLAFPLGSGQFEKINAVNAYAEAQFPGEGAKHAAAAISAFLQIPIDHYVKIDFRGFSDFINALGGVDVQVGQGFTDNLFPTDDNGWTTVSFKKGWQHMSGDRALTFARSRHGNNGEGSDFARSHRQQLVMLAVREKFLSFTTLGDPHLLASLYASIADHVQTDLSVWDLIHLAPLANNFSPDRVNLRGLTDGPKGELTAATVNGAYMLFPKKPDWSEIRAIVQQPFDSKEQQLAQDRPTQNVKIEIKNGTMRTGFASKIAVKLEQSGYEVTAFGNAVRRGYERSVIFDLTGGKKMTELSRLRHLLDADVSLDIPPWFTSSTATITNQRTLDGLSPERILSTQSDFLIILGENSYAFIDRS